MMKKIYAIFLVVVSIILNCGNAFSAPFIEGLEDVPFPKGMKQVEADNISFGNEESRLVEAYITGDKIKFSKLEKFYLETLPQLGWSFQGKRENTISFYREGESLDIVKERENPLIARITLKSQQ